MNGYTSLAVQDPTNPPNAWDAIAMRVIEIAARQTPGHFSERLEEEWLACLPEMGGAVARLRFALGCLWAATMIHHDLATASAPVTSVLTGDIRLRVGGPRGCPRWSPQLSTAADKVICDLNTTPLIDVMLVLIVTLIVSLPSMTHAVKLELARVAAAEHYVPPEIISLDIDFDGTVIWNGTSVGTMQALEGYYQAEAQKASLPQINLRPDRRAPYDVVAKVLASAQRNGMTNLRFVNTAEFR
jgi:biopolymer transport protein ExbD